MNAQLPRIGIVPYDRTFPIVRGEVDGADAFNFVLSDTMDITMGLLEQRYDAGEMSLAAFVKAKAEGYPLRAVPIFTNRKFFHQYIYVARDSEIRSLSDLKGRRLLVTMYWMTSSIWHRQILEDEAGITPADVEWYSLTPERLESMVVPEGVRLELLAANAAQNGAVQALTDGVVDCFLTAATSPELLAAREALKRPFADLGQTQRQYYERTGIFPIVHLLVCQEDLLASDPGAADRLDAIFQESKRIAYTDLQDESRTALPLIRTYIDDSVALFGDDPYRDGLEANRQALETFLHACHRQGLTSRLVEVDELF
ncbi:MAG: PhnD/SsuA/transferrin family substrate-binding protein [Dehalococcoidia bacterium]